jgi:hypothetical protein
MQTVSSKGRLREFALDISWSLWTELGLSGWERRHELEGLDLEPLILFSAWLGRHDHRLRDESLDWCLTNMRFVSATRLRGLLKQVDNEVVERFGDYSATVLSKAPNANWPGAGNPWRFAPSKKSAGPDLTRAALLQLRLRALFGVGSRAELLRLLLIDMPRGWSAGELAIETGYAKVNVAATLDSLALAGVVRIERSGTQFRYRLARPSQLIELAEPVPSFQPDWFSRFSVMVVLVRWELEPPARQTLARAANAVRFLRQMEESLARLGLLGQAPARGRPEFNEEFDTWSNQLLAYWAGFRDPVDPNEAVYEVRRDEIAWLATIREPHRAPKPVTLPDWEALYKEHPRSDSNIADDSAGALLLAHELMRRAYARVGVALEPFRYQPEVIAFANEQLRTIAIGQSRAFSESFLRLWRAERVGRTSATTLAQGSNRR